jgi:hypothetical protein
MSASTFSYTTTRGIINFFGSAFGSYDVSTTAAGSLEFDVSATSVKPEHSNCQSVTDLN